MYDQHPDRRVEPIASSNSFPVVNNSAFHQKIQLLEERLRVYSQKRKVGDVLMRKEVETQMIQVPVRREKLIIEQLGPTHKQLAVIDLGKTEYTENEIASLIDHSESSLAQSPQDPAISLQAAHQVLSEILSRPGYEHTNIRLSFENPELRSIYQQWLKRHLADI
jgi:hypothetical protein